MESNTTEKNYLHNFLENKTRLKKSTYLWIIFWSVIILMLFLPWRQTIRTSGQVTTLYPEQRPQQIETVIGGRIEKWKVKEGDFVKKGDTILILSEVKAEYFDPKAIELNKSQVSSKEQSIQSNRNKILSQDNQIDALLTNMDFSLNKGRNKVEQNILKVQSDSADLVAIRIDNSISFSQLERNEKLYKEGLKSLTELEQKRLKFQETSAKVKSAENKYLSAKAELQNSIIELGSIKADYKDKISKARGERNSTESYVFNTEAEIAKMSNYINNLEIRSGFYAIKAPQNGYITRTLKAGLGENIKESEAVATIVPSEQNLAVELFADAIDIPYLEKGELVRIQFEGFPVLQISGIENGAIGTFSGRVYFVEQVNSVGGKFRYLVIPDKKEHWPENLSIGSGAISWTLLQKVPIWFELWRILNAFPPNISKEELNKIESKANGKKK